MTIGIAVAGPRAGLAVFEALRAVERVSRGSIGGFVSFVAVDAAGNILRAETQRGGTATLFTAGESTGVPPPPEVAGAPLAALMSSGPDRPAPLSQFTPADPAVGLITGHRLPNMPGIDGMPLNQAVLRRMAEGAAPSEAVDAELARNPDADAGVIALARDGRLHLANTAFVANRADLGSALLIEPRHRAAVAVLHNSIHPCGGLAALAANAAFDVMAPADGHDLEVYLEAGLQLELAGENCIHLGRDDRVERLTVTQSSWLGPECHGAAVNFAASVRRGDHLIGHATTEPYCVAVNGRLVAISGRGKAPVAVRLDPQ